MAMLMFRMEQRVRIIRDREDHSLIGRKAVVVKINEDGSALLRVDGGRGLRAIGKTVWPEDCEPL
jgi:hypothetical protein